MAIWLFRAGKYGELEQKFLDDNCVYLAWSGLNVDISKLKDKGELTQILVEKFPDQGKNTIRNWVGQTWPVGHDIKKGDWLILPSKKKSAIHIGEVTGSYQFLPSATDNLFHKIPVNWFAPDLPRSNFDQDLLYSFGAFMTICRIQRNDAELRIKSMKKNNWVSSHLPSKLDPSLITPSPDNEDNQNDVSIDWEELAYDEIAKHLEKKFAGHGLTNLITEILKAKGYTVYQSPPGPDKGVDILAGPEPFGFGRPRLCIQVKSGNIVVDRPTLDQLVGTMQNTNSDQGILVSWSGFKNSVDKEKAAQFFRVRLWDSKDIIAQLFETYHKLSETIQAEIPLKRVWMLALES